MEYLVIDKVLFMKLLLDQKRHHYFLINDKGLSEKLEHIARITDCETVKRNLINLLDSASSFELPAKQISRKKS